MLSPKQTADLKNWAEALDNALVQRLWQRQAQPGMMHFPMVRAMIGRLVQMSQGLPLLDAWNRRWDHTIASQRDLPPIVYAQPRLPEIIQGDKEGARREAETAVFPPPSPLPVISPQRVSIKPSPALLSHAPEQVAPVTSLAPRPKPHHTDRPGEIPIPSTSGAPLKNRIPFSDKGNQHTTAVSVKPEASKTHRSQLEIPLPVVKAKTAFEPSSSPVMAAVQPGEAVKDQTAVIRQPVPSRADVLPLVQPVQTPPATPTKSPTAVAVPSSPSVAPPIVKAATPVNAVVAARPLPKMPADQPDTTPALPLVREQTGPAAGQPSPEVNRPLPLVGGTSGVIQRTAVHQTPSTPRPHHPTPTHSRPAGIKSQTSPAIQRSPARPGVIQRDEAAAENEVESSSSAPGFVDIDELVEKVHRQFVRHLTVEGERRGRKSWP